MRRFRSVFLVLVAMASVCGLWGRKDDPFIFLHEEEVLQVEFVYNADLQVAFGAPSVAEEMERRAQMEFRDAMGAVLERSAFPMAVEVLEPGDRAVETLPVLRVHAVRWQRDDFGRTELVLRVKLLSDGHENFLGSYREEEGALGSLSGDRLSRIRVKLMTKALGEVWFGLNEHFRLPEE